MSSPTRSTTTFRNSSPNLVPGPEWRSFEKFRIAGGTALEAIGSGTVAKLQAKSGTFRILRDEDFQKLLGLAAEVHRLKRGIPLLLKAAKVVANHPDDRDSIELLLQSSSLLSESDILPESDGHEMFPITREEAEVHDKEDVDILASEIPRPKL
jgi:hypothetical protein